jgi:hypothetical protein
MILYSVSSSSNQENDPEEDNDSTTIMANHPPRRERRIAIVGDEHQHQENNWNNTLPEFCIVDYDPSSRSGPNHLYVTVEPLSMAYRMNYILYAIIGPTKGISTNTSRYE